MSSVTKSELQEKEEIRLLRTRLYRSLRQLLCAVDRRYSELGSRVRELESVSMPIGAAAAAEVTSPTSPAAAVLVQPPEKESEEDEESQSFALLVEEHLDQDSDSDYSLPGSEWERRTFFLSKKEKRAFKAREVREATQESREGRGLEQLNTRVNCLTRKLENLVDLLLNIREGAPTTHRADVTSDCHCTRLLTEIRSLWRRVDWIIARLEVNGTLSRPGARPASSDPKFVQVKLSRSTV